METRNGNTDPKAEAEAARCEFELARSLMEEAFSKAPTPLKACVSLADTATSDPDQGRRKAAAAALVGIIATIATRATFPPSPAKTGRNKAATLTTRAGAKARPA